MQSSQHNKTVTILSEKIESSIIKNINNAEYTTVNAPNALTIGARAFQGQQKLQSAYLPNVKKIEDSAFTYIGGLKALESVTMPLVDEIGRFAFSKSGLISADTPSVVTINHGAFAHCQKLQSTVAPEAKFIGQACFYDCPSLASITMPRVETIGELAFGGSKITFVEVNHLSEIGKCAFQFCKKLHTFAAPVLKNIAGKTFGNCPNLSRVYIPEVKNIDNEAFNGSTNPEKVVVSQDLINQHNPETDAEWWKEKGINPENTAIFSLNMWANDQNIELSNTTDLLMLYRLNQEPDYQPSWPEIGRTCPNIPFHLLVKVLPEEKQTHALPTLSNVVLEKTQPKTKNDLLMSYAEQLHLEPKPDENEQTHKNNEEASKITESQTADKDMRELVETFSIKDVAKIFRAATYIDKASEDPKGTYRP